jgi:hemerythrin
MLWNTTYETGNAQVDSEHKEIFKMVETVLDASVSNNASKVEETVDFLANYTVNHFKNEELLMEESNYPSMSVHKKQHDDFVATVLELRANLKDLTRQDIERVVVNWLTDHVLGSDKLMANHYRNFKG